MARLFGGDMGADVATWVNGLTPIQPPWHTRP
jgi:hypothetical protein